MNAVAMIGNEFRLLLRSTFAKLVVVLTVVLAVFGMQAVDRSDDLQFHGMGLTSLYDVAGSRPIRRRCGGGALRHAHAVGSEPGPAATEPGHYRRRGRIWPASSPHGSWPCSFSGW